MKKSSKIIIAILATIGISSAVYAKGECSGNFENGGEYMFNKVSKKLDLNEAQQVNLSALQDKVKTKMQMLHQNKAQRKGNILALLGDEFDQTQAMSLLETRSAKMNDNAPEMIAAFANFYDSLDATQQQEVRQFMSKRGGRGFMGFGSGKHRGHGKGHSQFNS